MKSITADIVQISTDLNIWEGKSEAARIIRDNLIYRAFVSGERQADIAMFAGLSVSTIKHIVAAERKIK